MTFQGQVVVITGASSGIGVALAEAFAQQGARVALLARRGELSLIHISEPTRPY